MKLFFFSFGASSYDTCDDVFANYLPLKVIKKKIILIKYFKLHAGLRSFVGMCLDPRDYCSNSATLFYHKMKESYITRHTPPFPFTPPVQVI